MIHFTRGGKPVAREVAFERPRAELVLVQSDADRTTALTISTLSPKPWRLAGVPVGACRIQVRSPRAEVRPSATSLRVSANEPAAITLDFPTLHSLSVEVASDPPADVPYLFGQARIVVRAAEEGARRNPVVASPYVFDYVTREILLPAGRYSVAVVSAQGPESPSFDADPVLVEIPATRKVDIRVRNVRR